ncbi:hypothetical protein EUGRSUZ_K02368 [Eucalyptus grandis]|uniref:Uncharacterized protein n=2 Tax=Eucalyptus grandis TaxID=71139 RepID=A0ACC3IXS3_EUCGR|nr:hypothetical protein EUGRSUZ_K02368 [Eucalyptus grandis]
MLRSKPSLPKTPRSATTSPAFQVQFFFLLRSYVRIFVLGEARMLFVKISCFATMCVGMILAEWRSSRFALWSNLQSLPHLAQLKAVPPGKP